jgi:hypothetical protein
MKQYLQIKQEILAIKHNNEATKNIKLSKTLSPAEYSGSPIKAMSSGSVMSAKIKNLRETNPENIQTSNENNLRFLLVLFLEYSSKLVEKRKMFKQIFSKKLIETIFLLFNCLFHLFFINKNLSRSFIF